MDSEVESEPTLSVSQLDRLAWVSDQLYTIQQALMYGDTQMVNHHKKISGAIYKVWEEIESILQGQGI